MDFHSHHPLQPFWNLAAAPIQSQALALAIDHDLFSLLEQPASTLQLSQRLALNLQNTRAWLDLLWSMGLLARGQGDTPRYRSTALATRFFTAHSPDNCAQAWRYRQQSLGAFALQMDERLCHGTTAEQPAGDWAQAAQVQIHQEQRAVSVPAVLELLEGWPLPEQGHFMDLGGGPGHIAIALAHRLPSWTGTLCDLPATVQVAARHIEGAGVATRVGVRACNLDVDALVGGCDLIWCSSVLHFLADPAAALDKMRAALNPGGRLIIAHAQIAADADQAALVTPFYTPLLMRGHHVPQAGEITRALSQAGFTEVRTLGRLAFPMAPVWVHTGTRP